MQVEESEHSNKRRRRRRNKERTTDPVKMTDLIEGGDAEVTEHAEVETTEDPNKPRILMVRTENVLHEPFESTQETKVH